MFWLIAAGLDNVLKFWSWSPLISRLGGFGGFGGLTVVPPGPGPFTSSVGLTKFCR